jgi:3-hydroxy-3-methylglutaryl CoA synthase
MKHEKLLQKFQDNPDFYKRFRETRNAYQHKYAKDEQYRKNRREAVAFHREKKKYGLNIRSYKPVAQKLQAKPQEFIVTFD